MTIVSPVYFMGPAGGTRRLGAEGPRVGGVASGNRPTSGRGISGRGGAPEGSGERRAIIDRWRPEIDGLIIVDGDESREPLEIPHDDTAPLHVDQATGAECPWKAEYGLGPETLYGRHLITVPTP